MLGEASEGLGRVGVRVFRQYRFPSPASGAPARIVQTDAAGEVGPSVPAAFGDFVEVLEVSDDVSVVRSSMPCSVANSRPSGVKAMP